MKESFPTPESPVSKEQVIAAYKKFIDRGITNPDSLNLDDSEVQEAHQLFDKWQLQEDTAAAGNKDAERRINFFKTKMYVDAGFTDPTYRGDVLGWLFQDAGDLGKQPDNPENVKLRQDYAEEIRKIRGLLKSN